MKKTNKTPRVIIAIIAALLLILAIILVLTSRGADEPEAAATQPPASTGDPAMPENTAEDPATEEAPTPTPTPTTTPNQDIDEDEMQLMYKAAVMQILTTGDWTCPLGETTLSFTDTEYTAVYTSSADENYTLYATGQYEVTEATGTRATERHEKYMVKWNITDANGHLWENRPVLIKVVDGNEYTLEAYSLTFSQRYIKTVDIVFAQPAEPY